MSICLLRRAAKEGKDEHTNLHFQCRSGAAPRLAVRKPSPSRDTLLRLRANKIRLGTVAIFYGQEG